jgi:DNA-binding NtrC family response regulator
VKCLIHGNFEAMRELVESIETESKQLVIGMLRQTDVEQNPDAPKRMANKYIRGRKEKKPKGASTLETLALLREGNHPGAIAELRNLATSTVWGHLRSAIKNGAMEPTEVLDDDAMKEAQAFLDTHTECTQFGQILKIAESNDVDTNHVSLLWALRERELTEAGKP